MFLSVYSACFRKCEGNWLNFIAPDFSAGILNIVWKKSSKNSNSSFLPSNVNVLVLAGLMSADKLWVLRCDSIPAIASVCLLRGLLELEFCLFVVYSTIDNKLSDEMCASLFCGWVYCCGNGLFWVGRPVTILLGVMFCQCVMSVSSRVIVRF